jgi:dTDP-4-amino-4,6-dideoxygalactose transaminase
MSTPTLALLGGDPINPPGQDAHPRFSAKAIRRVSELLEAGHAVGLNKGDPVIREAEEAIARWQGLPHCLGTSSGHGALHAALAGLEITGGDEVITTPYTWGASTSCILHNGAVPVFADVSSTTGLLDPASVEAAITPKTRAILVVHIYGQPADMTSICAVARRHDLKVVEDGSQAHGALHAGRKVGTFGDAAGFSCMGGKLLAATEAGYLVTADADVYWRASMACQHMGRAPEAGFPDDLRPYTDSLVYTYRMSTINAVLLTEQLQKIDGEIDARRENARAFADGLDGVRSVALPSYADGDAPSYHMLTMNFDDQHAGVTRATYSAALKAEGVSASPYVPSPISQWTRLDPDSGAPRSMWDDVVRASGRKYADTELPNCDRKIAHGLEMGWNYVVVDKDRMSRLADAFQKVEENLPALRDHEATTA